MVREKLKLEQQQQQQQKLEHTRCVLKHLGLQSALVIQRRRRQAARKRQTLGTSALCLFPEVVLAFVCSCASACVRGLTISLCTAFKIVCNILCLCFELCSPLHTHNPKTILYDGRDRVVRNRSSLKVAVIAGGLVEGVQDDG